MIIQRMIKERRVITCADSCAHCHNARECAHFCQAGYICDSAFTPLGINIATLPKCPHCGHRPTLEVDHDAMGNICIYILSHECSHLKPGMKYWCHDAYQKHSFTAEEEIVPGDSREYAKKSLIDAWEKWVENER